MAPSRTLVVVRHGKSSWKTNEPDLRRPLSARGTRDAVVVGQQLAPIDFDVVLLSPATRVQQTWQSLQMGGAHAREVRTVDALYHAWTSDVLDVLRALPAAAMRVLLIGHEPTLSDLILTLAVSSPQTAAVSDKFPTSAIAILTHTVDWDELGPGLATLAAFEVPRG
ncbi:MAG: SixA phosphatase family protein [Actinomycetes bacterium]